MRIALASDIHSEFYDCDDYDFFFHDLKSDDVDVLVLAGDILVGRNTHRFLHKLSERFKEIVYVAGNHEYYHGEFNSVQRHLHNTGLKNVHFLERETVEISGQRFVGATLWYQGGRRCIENEMFMNDFRLIHNTQESFRYFIYKYARESHQWLANNVRDGDVVVTHMLPSLTCIDGRYLGDPMNGFYAHSCDDIIEEKKPKLWLHGHSHNHYDQMIYDTRVVRNPHGYPRESGVGYKRNFRIEI